MNELEKQKLELEIKILKKPWFKKLEFYKVLIPTIAILASLYFAFGRGILDSEKSRLEVQKAQLKLDISTFEVEKNKLNKEVNTIHEKKTELEKQIIEYEVQKRELLRKLRILGNKVSLSEEEKALIKKENEQTRTFYLNELKKQYKTERSRIEQIENLKQLTNENKVRIAGFKAEKEFLVSKIKLSEIEKNELKNVKYEAELEVLKNQKIDYDKTIKELEKRYKENREKLDNYSIDEINRIREVLFFKESKTIQE